MKKPWPNALFLGILASVFSSVTYVINNSVSQSGGSWLWSAPLRYLWVLPILLALTAGNGWRPVFRQISKAPLAWILWSTVAFGVFYAPLCFASAYGPSWLVAGTFQLTILCGALITPLFRDPNGRRQPIPLRLFPAFLVILLGVFLIQWDQAPDGQDWAQGLLFTVPVLVSAVAYPLGNRKTMELCGGSLSTMQRLLAMTVCSLPFWLVLSLAALLHTGPPPLSQISQSLIVAAFSGVTATAVFFRATDAVRSHPQHLAMVESTQCGEVLFSLLGGVLLLGDPLPGFTGGIGLLLVVAGMLINHLLSTKQHILGGKT